MKISKIFRNDNSSVSISGDFIGGQVMINGKVMNMNQNIPKDEKMSNFEMNFQPWSKIILQAPLDIVVEKVEDLKNHFCKIEAAAHVIDSIEMKVSGKSLVISSEKGFATSLPIKITLGCPQLEEILVKSSGNLIAHDISSSSLSLSLQGSGDIEVSGKASKVNIVLQGSGNIDAQNLLTDTCNVTLQGSGDIVCQAEKEATLSLMGSGDIKFSGNAKINKRVMGSGDIKIKKNGIRP